MNTIDWIEKDVARARPGVRWTILALGAGLLPVVLGIGLRDSLDGVFVPRVFVPNALAAVLLAGAVFAVFSRSFSSSRLFAWGAAVTALAAFLAIERAAFPPGARTAYASTDIFWHESMRCFVKGSVTTVALGTWLLAFAFAVSSLPARRWRALISCAAGAAGAVMLGFHCDSSSWEHVLVGHVGPGVVIGALVFLVQELIFSLRLRAGFPSLVDKIRAPWRIG